MAEPEVATIEIRNLREALEGGDELGWQAFAHAADAADGRGSHPALGRCAGCGRGWTEEFGPLALLEALIDGRRAVGLLCRTCTHQGADGLGAMLERILRASLPPEARVVEKRVVHGQQAGHA